ncbi:hypothetical protein BN946_scf185016.g27 [Trametes cinnabarina]|uniref:Uncharacterized protein n=1 Tax=Pycnoporus cinnabarinus TaxID=5643 RepID=A0A060SHL5_PYCCI|nr:hypothetical protein BN946_scf185016.g27 [Trametes cinnabarina]
MRGPKLVSGPSDPSAFGKGSATQSQPKPSRALGSLFARRGNSQLAAYDRTAEDGFTEEEAQATPVPEAPAQEQEVSPAPALEDGPLLPPASSDAKGKKRALEPEDDLEEQGESSEEPPRQRIRIHPVSVRSYTTQCSLLRAKVSMIPMPAPDPRRGRECELMVFPADEEDEEFVDATPTKRSREEFEEGRSSTDDAEERDAKKARLE